MHCVVVLLVWGRRAVMGRGLAVLGAQWWFLLVKLLWWLGAPGLLQSVLKGVLAAQAAVWWVPPLHVRLLVGPPSPVRLAFLASPATGLGGFLPACVPAPRSQVWLCGVRPLPLARPHWLMNLLLVGCCWELVGVGVELRLLPCCCLLQWHGWAGRLPLGRLRGCCPAGALRVVCVALHCPAALLLASRPELAGLGPQRSTLD